MMAKGSRYCVPFRRRREGKTDYKARKALLLSGKPRLVVRGSVRNMVAQIILARVHGDQVIASAHSRELTRDFGWKASRGNIPSAYLTGFLCGMKAKVKGTNEAILDIGLQSPVNGTRIFATAKGVSDAGVNIPYGEVKIPEDEKINGKHIASYAEGLASSNPEEYKVRFSKYLKEKLKPEELPKHFSETVKALKKLQRGGKKT